MIDHTGLNVSDFERSKAFYEKVLGAIGYELVVHFPASKTGRVDVAGFGEDGKPDFWIYDKKPNDPPVHVAFRVGTREQVRAFHEAALAAGARDNGPPGPRPDYSPTYYAAFVIDLDGNNIEAVIT